MLNKGFNRARAYGMYCVYTEEISHASAKQRGRNSLSSIKYFALSTSSLFINSYICETRQPVLMAQSIPSVPIPPAICHLVGPGGREFVRKPLPGGWGICQFF